jgi:hypothetical protein
MGDLEGMTEISVKMFHFMIKTRVSFIRKRVCGGKEEGLKLKTGAFQSSVRTVDRFSFISANVPIPPFIQRPFLHLRVHP